MDVLITRPASVGEFHISSLSRELKAACPKVAAVTVAHHCNPYAVFVHVSEGEELTPEERDVIEQVVQNHQGS